MKAPSDHPSPRGTTSPTDPLLRRLVQIVEEQQVYLPITLYIAGRPVSGMLTSATDFYERAQEELHEIVGDDPSPAVRQAYSLLEEAFRDAYESDVTESEERDFLYLTEVCLLGARMLDLSNISPTPCLRFRLSSVDAFHLMSLTTDIPFETEELV